MLKFKTLYYIFLLCITTFISCKKEHIAEVDYRSEMRLFVQGISAYTKAIQPNFIIIPQNGHNLLTLNGTPLGIPATEYIQAIDGIGREDLFYGYDADDIETPIEAKDEMIPFMDIAKQNGLKVLVTDYCSTLSNVDNSYQHNYTKGYISFAANHRDLDNIPGYPSPIFNENSISINTLDSARNFLYIINTAGYESKNAFIDAVKHTNYDVIIMDINFNDEFFNAAEINSIKQKANGGLRKVICYMSIGEAEDYRFYWQSFWKAVPPQWFVAENAAWIGNYKVKYWDKEWQKVIYGSTYSYTNRILNAGFDGIYLDIIDAFEYFEN
ncbi:MAG: endo alpha-1,4 polygalactosaminidase [Bacteroidia bacterium]